ncbi:ferredoxin [Haloimpatiens sp. FM7330]|uniref:ferredoxin n=1 Tax=Haloimpatiens sp. FM7330 TaxID=3298610 RepID=UPI00363A487C
MKQIKVSEKCNGCGLCIVNCSYLQENSDGNAVPIESKAINDYDLETVKKIINDCPEKALSIVETSNTSKRGKAGLKDLIEMLKKKTNNFTVKKVSTNDVKLNCKDYYIAVPCSIKEYSRNYSSESQAKSVARDEFRRLCYSETAYRPIIKKVFVEYKVNVLKPYYTCEDAEGSVYFSYNKKIRKLLAEIYAEAQEICGGECALPICWKDFSIYLSERDFSISVLKEFDERSTSSGIISDLKDRGEYTSLDWYIDRMDFDYDEEYAGEGLFGKTKYKKKWYFSGFNEEAKEYIDDLKSSIDSMSSDISEEAANSINYVLGEFEKKVKEKLNEKIYELDRVTNS